MPSLSRKFHSLTLPISIHTHQTLHQQTRVQPPIFWWWSLQCYVEKNSEVKSGLRGMRCCDWLSMSSMRGVGVWEANDPYVVNLYTPLHNQGQDPKPGIKGLHDLTLTNLPVSSLASFCSSYTKLNIVPRTARPFSHCLRLSSASDHLSPALKLSLCVSIAPCVYCNQCFNHIIL